jgi:hypothetical protein
MADFSAFLSFKKFLFFQSLFLQDYLRKLFKNQEFLGGQVCVAASLSKDIRARKQTCLTTKLLKKTVFQRASLISAAKK